MFSIDDIIALTDRFLKELHTLYKIVDVRTILEKPAKEIKN